MKPELSPELKQRILASARISPSLTRRDEKKRGALLILCGLIACAALFGWLGSNQDERARALLLGTLLGTLAMAAAAWLVVARRRSMLGPSRLTLLGFGLAAPLTLLAWKVLWSSQFAGALAASPRVGFRCLGLTLAVGAVPLAFVLLRRRGTDPAHPRAAGFAFGAAGGLLGAAVADAWCPVGYVPHFLLGHVLPVVVLSIVGLLIGARVLAPGTR